MIRPALALGLAVLLFAGAAVAQPRPKAAATDITGAWRFETARYNVVGASGCQMTGTMTIVRGRTPTTYTCRFTATETCTHGQWSAEQTCTATRAGAEIAITSTIVKLTPPNVSYAPDNWQLTIRSSDLMTGELRSADIANVQFRRGPAFIS